MVPSAAWLVIDYDAIIEEMWRQQREQEAANVPHGHNLKWSCDR